MIQDEKLDFWIKNNLNVLMIGEKGVGKTHLAIQAFKRNNLRFKYFSGPTLDPWIDLLGCPREKVTKDGVSFLDFIQPKELAHDEVDCIFVDEISRAHYKVKNAILELLQFKSVNGRKFNNLKFVWAAMNPPDSSRRYQVEELDDAQWDRFQVHVTLDYKPDKKYFIGKFGPEKAKAAIEWWNSIDTKFKHLVSPRRLDYALEYSAIGGDLHDILSKDVNVTELSKLLGTGPIVERLKRIVQMNDKADAQKIVNDSNLYGVAERYIKTNEEYIEMFLPLLSEEKLMTLFGENNIKIQTYFSNKVAEEKTSGDEDGPHITMMRELIKAKTSTTLVAKARGLLQGQQVSEVARPKNSNEEMSKVLTKLQKKNRTPTQQREILDSLSALYQNSYHSTDQANAETMLAAAVKFGQSLSDNQLSGEYADVALIAAALNKLIKKPTNSLYISLDNDKETFKKTLDRLVKIDKDNEVPF